MEASFPIEETLTTAMFVFTSQLFGLTGNLVTTAPGKFFFECYMLIYDMFSHKKLWSLDIDLYTRTWRFLHHIFLQDKS